MGPTATKPLGDVQGERAMVPDAVVRAELRRAVVLAYHSTFARRRACPFRRPSHPPYVPGARQDKVTPDWRAWHNLMEAEFDRCGGRDEVARHPQVLMLFNNPRVGGGAEWPGAIENSPLLGRDQYVSSGGFFMRVGARHNRWFASDATGQYVHNFVSNNDAFLAWGLTFNERLYLSKSRFQPYISAGLGFLNISSRNSYIATPIGPVSAPQGFSPGFTTRFGAGLEASAAALRWPPRKRRWRSKNALSKENV